MSESAITANSLRKSYQDTVALRDISFTVPAGAILAIVGPDGAGKTTLLRIFSGILDSDSGAIQIFGDDYKHDFESKKSNIGYMPQRFGLYEDLTVQENIDFFADLFSVKGDERRIRIKRLLEFSRMDPFTDRLAGNLSGGMKQKLGLACALVHNPKILLLDEPTNGVDPVSRREFWRLLYDLNRDGSTIIISSSYMDEAERASRFMLMHKGAIIAEGVPAEIRGNFQQAVYELPLEQARAAKLLLETEPRFASVSLFGKSLHIATDRSVSSADVAALIRAQGVDSAQLRKIIPSFEDIYIGLSKDA
ncbi:MAG: ABC transporter ATP-binding protein [Candidatus Zixiibacteriota bacterium]